MARAGAALAARRQARPAIDRRFRCPRLWPLRSSSRGPGGRGATCWRVAAHAAGRLRRGGRRRSGFGARGTRLPARVIGAGAQAAEARRREAYAARIRPSRKTLRSKGVAIRRSAQAAATRDSQAHVTFRGSLSLATSAIRRELSVSSQCTARTLRIAALCESGRTAVRRRVLSARAQATGSPDGMQD